MFEQTSLGWRCYLVNHPESDKIFHRPVTDFFAEVFPERDPSQSAQAGLGPLLLPLLPSGGLHVACADLLSKVQDHARPRVVVSGHIHEAYGLNSFDGKTLFVNAASKPGRRREGLTCSNVYTSSGPV